MKNVFTLLLGFCLLSLTLVGQVNMQKVPAQLQESLPANNVKYTGNEILPVAEDNYESPIVEFRDPEVVVGETIYDLQTNSTNCKRISMRPDGTIVGVWTQGFDSANGYPGRGTGYNARENFAWSDAPTTRLESERIGWPNHVFTADGSEFIVSHTSNSQLLTLRRNALTDVWSEAYIPTTIPPGLLWPRAAVGGADGQTIHVMAITTPVANEGAVYEGVDGHIIYYRSLDGGATWDQQDVIIPGLGSDFQVSGSADSYYIDARGENVAIGIFDDWGDVLLFKSEDNGDSWTKNTLNDFPLDNYVVNSGYAYEDLPPFVEGERPDSMAIFSSDGFGSVLIDHNGMAHAFFGNMYISDVDLADAGSTYFPATDGISYWNESFGDNTLQTITATIDQNGNDTLDIAAIADIALYFASLTSMPSAGIDADGNMYLTYAGVIEDRVSQDDDAQHYRHVYVISSPDGGETWSDPVDVITEDLIYEPTLVDFVEAVFPTMVRDVDSKVRFIYMQDFRPGLSVRGDEDEASGNTINYFQFDVADFGVTASEELLDAEAFALKLAPNLTSTETTLSFNLPEGGKTDLTLVNMHGQMVKQLSSRNLAAGDHQENISVADLASGVYYLMIKVNGKYSAVELVKQ